MKMEILPLSTTAASRARRLGTLLMASFVVAGTAHAQMYSKTEAFRNSTVTGFTLGGAADNTTTPNGGRATLTAPTTDPAGEGYLRLTDAIGYQSGYVVDNTTFSAANGFSVSFDYFTYGGNTVDGGDGIAAFFTDGAGALQNFSAGASGGALGYAQRSWEPVSNGVPNGYLGIGFDEFGSFSMELDGRSGGTGRMANAVTVRGAGNGSAGYPYLTTAAATGFNVVTGGTTRPGATSASAGYRRAFITVAPVNGVYFLTVRIQHGTETSTVLASYQVPAPPATLRAGVAAATGGNNNIHEIRNLTIQTNSVTTAAHSAAFTKTDLALYPNPTEGRLTLDLTRLPAGSYQVQLVNMLGQQLRQQTLAGASAHSLNVEALPAGAYVVLVRGARVSAALPLVRN